MDIIIVLPETKTPSSSGTTHSPAESVKNFSSHILTEWQKNVLKFGLNAIPVYHPRMPSTRSVSLQYLNYRFHSALLAGRPPSLLQQKVTKFLAETLPKSIKLAVSDEPHGHPSSFANISQHDVVATKELVRSIAAKQIVIVPADKESAIVIFDRTDYDREGVRLLENPINYQQIAKPLHPANYQQTCSALTQLFKCGAIGSAEFEAALPSPGYRNRTLRMLPKTHKPEAFWINNKPPCRPVVPNHFTETAGNFVRATSE